MIRQLAVLIACAALLAGIPAPAQAHATLLFTTPTSDGAVPTSPSQVQLVFDQAVAPTGRALVVTGPRGEVRTGAVEVSRGGQVLSAAVAETLAPGDYQVSWSVTSPDGDPMAGDFRFAVGSSTGLSLTSRTPTTPGAELTGALRWLLFAGIALLLGGVVGERLARRTAEASDPRPPFRTGAALAVLGTVGLALVQAGGGSAVQGLGRMDVLLDSAPGRLAVAELALALLVLIVTRRSVVIVATVGIAVLEGLRAHPHAELPGWGAVLVTVHLIAAAAWLGALVQTVRVARSRGRAGARSMVSAYARLALWLVVTVVLAGTLAAVLLMPLRDLVPVLTGTAYGRWLAAKLGLVLLAVLLALAARWLLRRDRRQPSVAARLEIGALAGALAASSALTALAPPAPSDTPLPFPPPPSGPAVALGTRAGWIGLGVTASQGQLVVRLMTPDIAPGATDGPDEELTLAGNLATDTGTPRELGFRACGTGCFVAPVDWPSGTSTATLRAGSDRFGGGTAALVVPWPPRPAPGLLRKAVTATAAEPRVVVHEQVTSDTGSGLGDLTGIRLTGSEYLDAGPLSSGLAPVVVRLGEHDIALGYPAEATYVRLTLDHHDRIVREVLAAPDHLVTRSLVYPEHGH